MNKVLAILVLYQCKLEESKTFNTLADSLFSYNTELDMLVYDNSPIAQYDGVNFSNKNINIHYISDPTNPGVSKAYNIGATYARQNGKQWLLLLDQDTSFPLGAVEKYRQHIHRSKQLGAPVLQSGNSYISPCFFMWGKGRALKKYTVGVNSIGNISLLNSGLMIPLSLFDTVGGYNERISLDFSDHCFIERIKRITSSYYVLDVVCKHGLSAIEKDKGKVLKRFEFYLKGGREYAQEQHSWGTKWVLFLRMIKLSLRYKTLDFLNKYLQAS